MTAKLDLDAHRSGDTWPGLSLTVLDDDGAAVDLTGALGIIMQIKGNRNDDSDDAIFSASVGSGITIGGTPTEGKFTVDAAAITAEQADYYYDIQVTVASGAIYTVLSGTFPIRQDTSR